MKMPQNRSSPSLPKNDIYGMWFPDPRVDGRYLHQFRETVRDSLLEILWKYYHPEVRWVGDFSLEYFMIGPPRGKHGGIARIEIIYRHEAHGWRHVFAVTDSTEYGLRLWTEVRRYARQS